MRNTLNDLSNYLFESIERLNDDSLSAEELEIEIKRADAVGKTAKTIIENASLALSAKKHMDEYGYGESASLDMFGINNNSLIKENKMLKETNKNLRNKVEKLQSYENT